MTATRIMGIFAHPDDEALVAGGTIAACAGAGAEVAVVSCTGGELGPISPWSSANRNTLRTFRTAELKEAVALLGASEAVCLEFADGELPWEARLQGEIQARLMHWKPNVVITFSEEGLYWHQDHVAVHRAVRLAVRDINHLGGELWLYEATMPSGWAVDLVREMAKRGLSTDLWGLEPEAFGVPPESITTVLDVAPFVGQKLAALRAHRSQVGPDHLLSAIPPDLSNRFLGREYFIAHAPADRAGDPLGDAVRSYSLKSRI